MSEVLNIYYENILKYLFDKSHTNFIFFDKFVDSILAIIMVIYATYRYI